MRLLYEPARARLSWQAFRAASATARLAHRIGQE
jgi:hypothetical protein